MRTKLEASFDHWSGEIAKVIAEAQKAGVVARDLPAETLASFLLNAWEGAVMRSKVDRDRRAARCLPGRYLQENTDLGKRPKTSTERAAFGAPEIKMTSRLKLGRNVS